MEDQLDPQELASAEDTEVWVVWYEDRFALGPDRDPACTVSFHLTKQEAEARAEREGGPPDQASGKFDGFWAEPYGSLAKAFNRGNVSAAEVRRLLAEASARSGN